MIYPVRKKAFIIYSLMLATLLFSSACFAQLAKPQISIEIVNIDGLQRVHLSWEPVEGAECYNIYSTENPFVEDWGDMIATVGEEVTEYVTEESVVDIGSPFYFQITASAEPGAPDWLILVDGDPFGTNQVAINPFYISKYEVTQEEFLDMMGEWAFGCAHDPNRPAEMVSWFDAVEYCNRLSMENGLTPVYQI